jgi:hypothetical protein
MVTCKLWAQTANQLFMISATICHALKMNTSFFVPTRSINPRLWPTYIHHLPKAIPGRITKHYFAQPSHSFTPIPDQDDITLEGYFQSESYWNDYKKKLADILQFSHKPDTFIAIHHRRGDYLKYPERFPVLDMDYYEQAIRSFLHAGYSQFKVFSDDIPWCKDQYAKMGWAFEYSNIKDPLQDIKHMYNAAGYVLANSTFGLFPALLRSDNPVVVAPAEYRWFGPEGQEMMSADRMPGRFIKL